ncbi:MAG: double-strand break repair helicase AddA [Dongiaceae bacterium]
MIRKTPPDTPRDAARDTARIAPRDALAEANERQREGADPSGSAWVSASAGSGKTKLLVDRVLRLLLADVPPERILCLTYTRAAAAEMANRIAKVLGDWAACDEAKLDKAFVDLLGWVPKGPVRILSRRLFARVLDVPGGLKIMTIHAFCQSLLRRFPLEAGVAPQFELIEDRDSAQLLGEAIRAALGRAAARPASPLGRAVASVTARIGEDEFVDLIGQLRLHRSRLRRHLEREGGVDGAIGKLRDRFGLAAGDSEAGVLRVACADAAFDADALRQCMAALLESGPNDIKAGTLMADWLAGDVARRSETFDAYARAYLIKDGTPRKKFPAQAVLKKFPQIADTVAAETARILAIQEKRTGLRLIEATGALLVLGSAVLDGYASRKAMRAALDYDDLIEQAAALLADAGAAWVHYKLDRGIDHVLVDEAQDTSPAQWRIIQALTAEFFAGKGAERDAQRDGRHDAGHGGDTRTIFAVGDRKQSIFSFQGADPDSFELMRDWFAERIRETGEPLRVVPLGVSFRSVEAVLNAVDNVFSKENASNGVVEADVAQLEHLATRTGQAGRVELWPLVTAREIEDPEPWAPPVKRFPSDSPRERLARGVAAHIADLVNSEAILESRDRPIRPGDILVLVRTRNQFLSALVRELKERRIGVAGVDRMNLTEQIAVMDLRVLAEFLLHIDDDLALATVLRGPLVGLSDDELFDLAWKRQGTLWSALRQRRDVSPSCKQAFDFLSMLLASVDYLPPFELFQLALGRNFDARPDRAGRRAMIARLGLDAADPLDEFLTLALDYDRRHAPSLQGFLAWFGASDTEVKRDLDRGSLEQVRIMTVHGAKGLQAPIVYLPDTTSLPQDRERLLWFPDNEKLNLQGGLIWAPRRGDEEDTAGGLRQQVSAAREAEYRRLLYVAMTRAEERLYIGGWLDRKKPLPDRCWYRLIEQSLVETIEPFAFDNTAQLSEEGWTGEGRRHSVERKAEEPDKAEDAVVIPLPPPLPDWAMRLPDAEPAPSRPLAPSRPVGGEPPPRSPLAQMKSAGPEAAGPETAGPEAGGPEAAGFGRETGYRRGRVLHRLLELLPSLAPAQRRAAGATLLAAHADAFDDAARAAMLDEVLRILDAPDLGFLFGPDSLAEVPLVGEIARTDGSRLALSAQIDRLAIVGDTVSIVDYKTLRPVPPDAAAAPAHYRRQLAAYRALAGAIWPDKTVRCFLLWTDGPLLMEVPDALLDEAAA